MGYKKSDISAAARSVGAREGDVLFLHSAIRKLGQYNDEGPVFEGIVDALFDVTGPTGTIAVPTFNFSFCGGAPYDVQNTPSDGMGQFSEYIRKKEGSHRSPHPFQSIAAFGAEAKELTDMSARSAFSEGSSFDRMVKANALVLYLGVPFVETFAHISEERAAVDYRFWKIFNGDVTNRGIKKNMNVDFFARHLTMVPEPILDLEFLRRYLVAKQIITSAPLGDGLLSAARSSAMVDDLTAQMISSTRFALTVQI